MFKIAVPKGRMGNAVYEMFERSGYGCAGVAGNSRKLVFTDMGAGVSYLMIKPQDVAVYVERGAADVGVVGKDVLLETDPQVYELLDLGFGRCKVVVASPVGYIDDRDRILRVATKYPNITKRFFTRINRDIDIIKLNGSIELAPLLGLSDVIVDIVETGKTLHENNLYISEEISESSARLIANVSASKFKGAELGKMLSALSKNYNCGGDGHVQ